MGSNLVRNEDVSNLIMGEGFGTMAFLGETRRQTSEIFRPPTRYYWGRGGGGLDSLTLFY